MMMDGWIERVRRGSMGSEEGAPVGGRRPGAHGPLTAGPGGVGGRGRAGQGPGRG